MKRKQTGWNKQERNYMRPGYNGRGRNIAMVTRLKQITKGTHWYHTGAVYFPPFWEHGYHLAKIYYLPF